MGSYTIQYDEGCENFGLLRGEEAFGPYPVPTDDLALVDVENGVLLAVLKEHEGPLIPDTVYALKKETTVVEQGVVFDEEEEEDEDDDDSEGDLDSELEDEEEEGE